MAYVGKVETKTWKGTEDEAHASKVDQTRIVTGPAKDPAVKPTKVNPAGSG
jgi:hypothetical protein